MRKRKLDTSAIAKYASATRVAFYPSQAVDEVVAYKVGKLRRFRAWVRNRPMVFASLVALLIAWGIMMFWASGLEKIAVSFLLSFALGTFLAEEARRARPALKRGEPEQAKFCSCCGSRAISYAMTHGFHPVTGAPNKYQFMACPDWDRGTFGIPESYEVGQCNKPVQSDPEELTVHHGHADGDVSGSCHRCIMGMEASGIITREDAEARLKELDT